MSEENQDKELQKKQEEQNSSKQALKAGAKAAANAYAGPIGGKAVDLASKTKLGNAALNAGGQMLNKANPAIGKVANAANKAGALSANGKGTSDSSKSSDDGNSDSANDTGDSSSKKGPTSPFNSKGKAEGQANGDGDGGSSYADKIFSLITKNKTKTIPIIGGFFLNLIFLVAIIFAVTGPVGVVVDFFTGIADAFLGFFDDDDKKHEEEYYATLAEVQAEINHKYGVCVDVNLITAALTINVSSDEFLEDGQEEVVDGEDNPDYDEYAEEPGEPTIDVNYKLMKKQIKLLANMQMITAKYELSEDGNYCSDSSETIPVTEGEKDSSTKELIAQNDMTGFAAFFAKKSNEEKNYAYYIYKPPYKEEEITNNDGSISIKKTCTKSYAKNMLPKQQKILSIGDLKTMEDSVFYWNLVNSFIPEYYSDYLPSEENELERTEKIKKMAEEIYLLYKDYGPNQTCAVSYAGPSSLCPNGVTVEDTGTFDLEEYVAGVVGAEMYDSFHIESKKALAVAARTYVLKLTDYCSKPIVNSSAAQNFTRNYSDTDKQAAMETAGEILVDSSGQIFLSEYDSWDCPGSNTCSYQYIPDSGSHTVTISDRYLNLAAGGHGRGMSQIAAADMAYNGTGYKEILSYFYKGSTLDIVLSPTVTDGSIIKGPIENYLVNAGSSVDKFNSYIFDQVRKAGLGTRNGVVAAATSLVSGFYSQTGYILPYELYPSGKYSGYGIDKNWGTNTGRSDYPLNGLDCSGFISWAVHNGGFSYDAKSASGWGSAGAKRPWTKGITDSSALPGDLIFNEPARANGTTGHIRMIVSVDSTGYVVAEASSRQNGVRIINMPFKSTGNYYLVDMTNYYSNASVVTDYPS